MKLIKKILFVLLFVMMFALTSTTFTSKGEGVLATVINVGPGEDTTKEFLANWYSDFSDTKLYYTTSDDPEFKNQKVVGECAAAYFGEPSSDWAPVGYDGKYRCQATIGDLEPETKYIYRIGNGTYTETRSFTTSGGTSALFAFTADPQQYSSGSPRTIWETHLDDLYYYAEREYGRTPDLMLGGGDMTNTGGSFPTWTYIYDNKYFVNTPITATIGNHEYLDGNNGNKPGDGRFYSAMYNNPKNGPEGKDNESFWFKWNNAIVFVWNNIPKSESNYKLHYEWIRSVLEKEQYQFTIMLCHFPIYGGSSDSNLMTDYFRPLIEEIGFDLCLAGHDHSYKLRENYYKGKKSTVDGRGTYYLEIADTYTTDTKPVSALLNITDKSIVVKQYSSDKTYYGQFIVSAKRSNVYADESLDKDLFMSKLKIEANDNNYKQAFITVDKSGYGMVNSVKVYDGEKLLLDQWTDSDIYNKYTITGLTPDKDYSVRVVASFKDGETKETTINFSTRVSYGTLDGINITDGADKVTFKFTPNLKPATTSVNVYVNGVLAGNFAPTAKFVRIDKTYLTEATNLVEFKAVDSDKEEHLIATYNYGDAPVIELTVETKALELTEGEEGLVKATATEGGLVKYASSDATVATVDASGKVKALKAGETTITVTVEGTDLKETVSVKVNAKEVEVKKYTVKFYSDGTLLKEETVEEGKAATAPANPTKEGYEFKGWDKDFSKVTNDLEVNAKFEKKADPVNPPVVDPDPVEPEPQKKGCGAGAIQMVYSLITIFGLVVVFKKRRY